MVLYPNKLPESERVCFGICTQQAVRPPLLARQEVHNAVLYLQKLKMRFDDSYRDKLN